MHEEPFRGLRIAVFAGRPRLPMVALHSRIAEAAGLGVSEPEVLYPFRGAATYVDRILKEANPGTVSVEECTRGRIVVDV